MKKELPLVTLFFAIVGVLQIPAYSNSKVVLPISLYQDSLLHQYSDSFIKSEYKYGAASFYSKNLEGTLTSTGEIFRHNKLTAASNNYKLNTWLKVTNISNGKSIVVRVNDRMHPRMARKGRIVDLSYLGAKKLGFVNKGITKVKVQVVDNINYR